jgi:hypothetical protein
MATIITITPLPFSSWHQPALVRDCLAANANAKVINVNSRANEVIIFHTEQGDFTPHDFTAQEEADLTAVVNDHNSLTINADTTSITVLGQEEATITCDELLTDFDYVIWQGSDISSSGSVSDGSIEFSANEPGTYTIEIIEQGTNRTGYIEVIAS